jgi:hypothetical protein
MQYPNEQKKEFYPFIIEFLEILNIMKNDIILVDEYTEYKDTRIKLDIETGYILGLYLTNNVDLLLLENDIKIRHDKYFLNYRLNENFIEDITNCNTSIPNFIFTSTDDCIKGFLSGYFRRCIYDNGNIKIRSNNDIVLNGISFLLSYFSIFSCIESNTLIIKAKYTESFERYVIEEIWKDINNKLELTKYSVSNLGKIKNKSTKHIMKKKVDINGYYRFTLIDDNNKKRHYFAHQIVLISFKLYEKNKVLCDHINRIRNDNRISNLRWVTYSENSLNKIFIFISFFPK